LDNFQKIHFWYRIHRSRSTAPSFSPISSHSQTITQRTYEPHKSSPSPPRTPPTSPRDPASSSETLLGLGVATGGGAASGGERNLLASIFSRLPDLLSRVHHPRRPVTLQEILPSPPSIPERSTTRGGASSKPRYPRTSALIRGALMKTLRRSSRAFRIF